MVVEASDLTFVIAIAFLVLLLWTLLLLLVFFCIEQCLIKHMVKKETLKMMDNLRRMVYLSMVADNASSDTIVWNPDNDLDVVVNSSNT